MGDSSYIMFISTCSAEAASQVRWICCAPSFVPDCLLLQSTVSYPLSRGVGALFNHQTEQETWEQSWIQGVHSDMIS